VTLAPGSRVGPYEITARIGEGGMGEVRRAVAVSRVSAIRLSRRGLTVLVGILTVLV
jgi:hypothetical protein